MLKGPLLKTVVLVIALAAVLAVILATMNGSSGADTSGVGGTQTFFEQFVVAGGPIVWLVLLPMSFVMVYLVTEHSLTIRRKRLFPADIGRRIVEMAGQSGAAQLEAKIAERDDLVSIAVMRAVTHGRDDWFRMRNLVFESLEEQGLRLFRKIEWLNLIGNVSPMVGLFGTVFGMIKLFNAIVVAGGQPRPAQLAEGISVALVTTLWGLLIAIPALAVHGVFRNRIETLTSDATAEAENILPEIMLSIKKQKGAEPPKHKPLIRELGGKQAGAFRGPSVSSSR